MKEGTVALCLKCRTSLGASSNSSEMPQAGIKTRLNLRQSDILPQNIIILTITEGRLYVYLFTYTLSATWSAQFMKRAIPYSSQQNSSTKYTTHVVRSIYIFIYRETVSLYHKSSVCLDTQDTSSWDRISADLMSVEKIYIYIYI